MLSRNFLDEVFKLAHDSAENGSDRQKHINLPHMGIIYSRNRQQIRKVPIWSPSFILVLAGSKAIYVGEKEIRCNKGDFFVVPAPSSFNMLNIPDKRTNEYLSIYIPFKQSLLEKFLQLYRSVDAAKIQHTGSISGKGNVQLYASVLHFLEVLHPQMEEESIIEHRILEILLCLVKIYNVFHIFLPMSPSWTKRVSSLILTDPSRKWRVHEVCDMLRLSESTLNRNLRKENTNFQLIIDDIRFSKALTQIQCTSTPINRIAYDIGYNSVSRFTERFRERFNITPTQLRKRGSPAA